MGKHDKKSNRYKTIKHLFDMKRKLSSTRYLGNNLSNSSITKQGLYPFSKAGKRSGHYVNPNGLIERLELLILETKAGHDGFMMKC